jgi:hypothetical protein
VIRHHSASRSFVGCGVTTLVLVLALSTTASAVVVTTAASGGSSPSGFTFALDSFAFPNEVRARHFGADDLYANYCFVLARALRQFFAFARFDEAAPPLDHAGYVRRIRDVVARPPWKPALPPPDRVVIPGYANLRELSRAEEAAVKEALGSRFWTMLHWTNWRVTFPVTRAHQERVARAAMTDIRAGRLPQLLVTNWPKIELNHTVVAYDFAETPSGVEFVVWDPNEPSAPGTLTFERGARRFWATRIYDTEPGPIRAFRMYHSRWL